MPATGKDFHLFIFADALGWQLAREKKFLEDLLPYRNPCQTLFGYSSTCDPTILTGSLPDEHGHFSFFVKADSKSPFSGLRWLAPLPEILAGHHRIRNRVSRWLARKLGYTGYFQLYSVPFRFLPYLDYTEKRDIYEPGGIIRGQETIFENWKRSGKRWTRSDWRKGDAENIAEIENQIEEGDIELAYLFTAGLDAVMHRYGTHGPEVDQAWNQFEETVRRLYQKAAHQYRDVKFYLFSDHGMANVTTPSDLMLRWFKKPFHYGRDYVAVFDSTMARFWFLNEKTRREATAWLADQPDGAIVRDEQLKTWNCFFPDRRYGELFYLLPCQSLFVPSFLNQRLVTGMHGYSPDSPEMTASWLTNDPHTNVTQLHHIFPVMKNAADSSPS